MSRLYRLWRGDPLRWTLWAIAAGTAVSGFVQMVAPGFILDILSAPSTGATRLFFGIIGMFMFIVGGALAHALLGTVDRRVVFWASLQKLCAAGAVSLGIANDVFSKWAILLATFDFLTGVLGFTYLFRERRATAAAPVPA